MSFDNLEKSPGWHTAFYYLSRHLNHASRKELTDKSFYGLVGINGPIFNHPNSQAKKSTAGELSRTIHSSRYAKDMRELYNQDKQTFKTAASVICDIIRKKRGWDDAELSGYYANSCWPDVWKGLTNEKEDSRPALNLDRIAQEAKLVFGSVASSGGAPSLTPERQMESMLHIIAFGFLDTVFMRTLIKGTVSSSDVHAFYNACTRPCLVRYADESCTSFVGEWDLRECGSFVIGRRTDSDSIESELRVSGKHGCVYKRSGAWYYEDMRSLNGSTVIKDGERITLHVDRFSDEVLEPVPLEPGDLIVVAGCSCYWFGERRERSALVT